MKPKHEKRLVELNKQLRESNKRANTAIDAGIASVGHFIIRGTGTA